jgi:phage baseplate assembly protein gpV
MSALASELRHLRREIARLHRKHELARMPGKVDEVREEKGDWQVRLELGRDPKTDEKVLTPWIRVQPASAGDLKIKVKPTKGEQMYAQSTSGVVGADTVAIWGAFDDDHQAPAGQDDLIIERGNSRFVLKDGLISLKSAGTEVELKSGHLNLVGDKVHTVGDTHLAVASKDQEARKRVIVEGLLDTPKAYAEPGPVDDKIVEMDAAIAAAAAAAAAASGDGGSA